MRKNFCSMAAAILLVAGCSLQAGPAASAAEQTASATATNPADEAAIKEVLASYETALNSSNTEAVMSLYSDDAVLLPQETPTVMGSKAVKQFYVGTFKAIKFDLKFQIAEAQVLSNGWAFLRTTSTGAMKILASGNEVPAHTQELFVLRKDDGQWKLARYSFSSTIPPAQR
jgi:uncharacterized protein (TIGR02246 family)